MAAWLTKDDESAEEEPEETLADLYDPELAWYVFKMLENTQGDTWQWLPCGGGILDQPESLWHDLMILMRAKKVVTEMLRPGLDRAAKGD
jgi:hypothetical protein